jgi:hypothetical protein
LRFRLWDEPGFENRSRARASTVERDVGGCKSSERRFFCTRLEHSPAGLATFARGGLFRLSGGEGWPMAAAGLLCAPHEAKRKAIHEIVSLQPQEKPLNSITEAVPAKVHKLGHGAWRACWIAWSLVAG